MHTLYASSLRDSPRSLTHPTRPLFYPQHPRFRITRSLGKDRDRFILFQNFKSSTEQCLIVFIFTIDGNIAGVSEEGGDGLVDEDGGFGPAVMRASGSECVNERPVGESV